MIHITLGDDPPRFWREDAGRLVRWVGPIHPRALHCLTHRPQIAGCELGIESPVRRGCQDVQTAQEQMQRRDVAVLKRRGDLRSSPYRALSLRGVPLRHRRDRPRLRRRRPHRRAPNHCLNRRGSPPRAVPQASHQPTPQHRSPGRSKSNMFQAHYGIPIPVVFLVGLGVGLAASHHDRPPRRRVDLRGQGTILGVALAAFVYAGLRSALLLTSSFNENDFEVVSGGLLILSVLIPNAASFVQRARALMRRGQMRDRRKLLALADAEVFDRE